MNEILMTSFSEERSRSNPLNPPAWESQRNAQTSAMEKGD